MRILVVEDQPKVASFIVKGLREERYAVDLASTGTEGQDLAMLNDYDLILMDVMLPGKNGFEVTRDLRQSNNSTPIIMLTVRDSIDDRVTGLDAGADDYLAKPFAFAELLARIRAQLRRGEGGTAPPRLILDDLSLDTVTHQLVRAGETIHLTNREYSLLEFLLRNAGRVVTRTSIIQHVWDMNFDSDTNLVDVYIRRLRQRMDIPFRVPPIHTVRGVGYVMRVQS